MSDGKKGGEGSRREKDGDGERHGQGCFDSSPQDQAISKQTILC